MRHPIYTILGIPIVNYVFRHAIRRHDGPPTEQVASG